MLKPAQPTKSCLDIHLHCLVYNIMCIISLRCKQNNPYLERPSNVLSRGQFYVLILVDWLGRQAKVPAPCLYQDTGNASQINPTCPGAEIWNSFYPPGPSMSLTMGPLQWSNRDPRGFFTQMAWLNFRFFMGVRWGSHLSWSQDRVCDQAVFLWNAKFSPLPAAFALPRNTKNWTLDRRLPSMRKNSVLCFEKIITIWKNLFFFFIVLFAINCTNQIKCNYLNFHYEEAQEKPPGL